MELDRLFHDCLRLVEEARAKALRPKASLGTHAEGVDPPRTSSQRDRLLVPANAPRQSRGTAQDLCIPRRELQRTAERRVRRLPIPVIVHLHKAQRDVSFRQIRLQLDRTLCRRSRTTEAFRSEERREG